MSPELETLDQLLGGELPLSVVRRLYPSDEEFLEGIRSLLFCGDVSLLASDGTLMSTWRDLLKPPITPIELNGLKLRITDQGIRTIA